MKEILLNIFGHRKMPNYPLDTSTKHMLLAATGCLGGDLCDAILGNAEQDEQKFVISIETGLFAIAVTSYYFTFHYRNDIPPLLLAIELSEMYKNHFSDLNKKNIDDSDNPIEDYFLSEARTTLSTTIGAMLSEELNSQKFYWTLSRVLYQRIRISCGNNSNSYFKLETEQIDEIETIVKSGIEALLYSLEYLLKNGGQK